MTIDECLKKAEVVLRAGENKSSEGAATRLSRAGLLRRIMRTEKGYDNDCPPEGLIIRLTKAAIAEGIPTAEEFKEILCSKELKEE